jgi:hypothetical protein
MEKRSHHIANPLTARGNRMKIIISIIFLLVVGSAYGQTVREMSIPTYKNIKNEADTSFWFKWKQELVKQIGLKNLLASIDTFYFRIWTNSQAVDIWSIGDNQYSAIVTSFAERYDEKLLTKGINKIAKIYSKQTPVDTARARDLFNILERLSISSIPSDNNIRGWSNGLDGEEYLIETSMLKRYEFKTYWTPRIFADTLNEAKRIQTFIDYLYADFKLYDFSRRLKLPAGSYKKNGISGIDIKPANKNMPGTIRITDLL